MNRWNMKALFFFSLFIFLVTQTTEAQEKKNKNVLVIGGGSIGVCSAYYLKQKGMNVTVVDKGEIAGGCSKGNAGLVVPSAGFPLASPGLVSKGFKDFLANKKKPFNIKIRTDMAFFKWVGRYLKSANQTHMEKAMPLLLAMGKISSQLHHELEDQCHLGTLNARGRMEVFTTLEGLEGGSEKSRLLAEKGIESKILSTEDALKIEENLGKNIIGAIYYPNDGNINPFQFLNQLAEILTKEGVNFQAHTEVLDFETEDGKITGVKTSKGTLHPDMVVIATGADTPEITKKLGITALVEAGEGYSITITKPKNSPSVAMTLGEDHIAVSPMGENLRLAGHLGIRGPHPSFNEKVVTTILNSAKKYLPFDPTKEKILDKWQGRRPCTPDGLPIIGKHPKYGNLIMATGHGTIGMHLGPVTGKLVSQIAIEEKTDVDISLMRCDRF